MEKKLFGSLDESLKEKLQNCKDETELQKVMADAGIQELGLDKLESVSGGTQAIPPEWLMKDD